MEKSIDIRAKLEAIAKALGLPVEAFLVDAAESTDFDSYRELLHLWSELREEDRQIVLAQIRTMAAAPRKVE